MSGQTLGRQISLVVVGDGITVAATIVSGMLLSRLLTQEHMGTYRQVVYLGQLSVAVVEFGLSTSIYRFWNAIGDVERSTYAKMLVILSLVMGGTASLVLAGAALPVSIAYKNPDLKTALLISCTYPFVTIPILFMRPILISEGMSLRATFLETLFTLAMVAGIAIPSWMGASLFLTLAIWISACALRLVAVPVVLRKRLKSKAPAWSWSLFSDLWGYLWPIQASRVPGLVTSYLDQFVMSLFLDARGFAVYSMGAREIPLVGMVGPSVSSVLIPHLVQDVAAGNTEQICRRWRKACLTTAVLTYPVAAFSIAYAVSFMQFMFSSTYRESSIPFRIFGAITFIRVVEYASLAKAFNNTGAILKSASLSAAVMAISALVLTWAFGVPGMASAVLLGYVAGAGYLLALNRSLLHRRVREFFPWHYLAFLGALAGFAVWVSRGLMGVVLPIPEEAPMVSLGIRLGAHFLGFSAIYGVLVLTASRTLPGLDLVADLLRVFRLRAYKA